VLFSAVIIFAIILAISFSPFALGSSINQLLKNKQYIDWINQCAHFNQGKKNPANQAALSLNDAVTYCTGLLQTYINQHTGNQSSSAPVLPAQQYPYQYPSQYPYQNPNTYHLQNPYSSQYPYQNPNPYQYQSQQPGSNQQNVNQSSSAPVQSQASPYQNPASPYQNPASPYQNPASPYQNQQQQPSSVTTNTSSTRSSTQQLPTLIVVTRVNNTVGSVVNPANLSQVVANAYNNPDGYTYSYHFMRGSQMGVTLNLQPGVFAVFEPTNSSKANNILLSSHSYITTYSGDCANVKSIISSAAGSSSVYGYGTIKPGESKTCIITNSLQKK
jgi:hypothetical protein